MRVMRLNEEVERLIQDMQVEQTLSEDSEEPLDQLARPSELQAVGSSGQTECSRMLLLLARPSRSTEQAL